MAVNYTDFDKIWASASPLTPYEFSENNYKAGWNFVGATPPSRQMWDFLQKNNDEKMQYLADNYLPLSGGTMTGNVTADKTDFWIGNTYSNNAGSITIRSANASYLNGAMLSLYGMNHTNASAGGFTLSTGDGTRAIYLAGNPDGTLTWNGEFDCNYIKIGSNTPSQGHISPNGTNCFRIAAEKNGYSEAGANIQLYGKSATTNAGYFQVSARTDSSGLKTLEGTPSGSLKWNGQTVQTSSDKRLKQDFSDVPADVLEAWANVEWKQFKYKDDVKQKGDSCRWHTGLVAQDVQEVCGDKILKYGILCHDVQEATEEQEAVDLWTIRYEEALCMEVIYLRSEIKKLREEIKALRTE